MSDLCPYADGEFCVFSSQAKEKHTKQVIAEILHCVQMKHLFPDSKTFVDMPMKMPREDVLAAWHTVNSDSHDEVKHFVDQHFNDPGSEVEKFTKFDDYKAEPPILDKIADPTFKKWASDLNDFWPQLGMRTKPEVEEEPERFTMIAQKNPFIVPGGRFREFYYWDSFWIVKGILLCGMTETARGMVENMAQMVDKFGYIPNGARTYYLNRSQPPLFCEMLYHYWKHTNDDQLVKEYIDSVEKEYNWFMSTEEGDNSHGIEVTGSDGTPYILNRYNSALTKPRPESYREDLEVAVELGLEGDEKGAANLYANIGAAAESGWDFTSRWFADKYHMKTVHITRIIPVDLNSFMYKIEVNLSEMYGRVVGDSAKATQYAEAAKKRLRAFNEFLWCEEAGQWYDYNIDTASHKKISCSSNYFPLYAGAFSPEQARKAYTSFASSELFNRGGCVGTVLYTREQWDYPNAWPPIQWLIVEALNNADIPEAKDLAQSIAVTWLYSNFGGWERSNGTAMHEKYDVRTLGWRGFGGEYEPQIGFGWSNGVAMCFMQKYGDIITYEECKKLLELDDKDYKENLTILDIKNTLNLTKGDLRHMMRHMGLAIERGLRATGKEDAPQSSLAMIPTFVTRIPTGNEEGTFLALHAGTGKHLRVAKIPMSKGECPASSVVQERYLIPPEKMTGTAKALFCFMASCIVDFVETKAPELMEDDKAIPLGFAFAFPVEQFGIASGRVTHWTKGYTIASEEGQDEIVSLLQQCLKDLDFPKEVKVMALLNDTVGTLVSGIFFAPDKCRVGMVAGNGINLAYYEPVSNIKKLGKDWVDPLNTAAKKTASLGGRCTSMKGNTMMIINTEWGAFGDNKEKDHQGNPVLLRSRFDVELDEASAKPGHHLYEKMIGGLYLGELCRLIIADLMNRKIIRSIPSLQKRNNLSMLEVNEFVNDKSENLDGIKNILAEQYHFKSLRTEREKIHIVCDLAVLRAGRLVAAGVGAVLMRRGLIEDSIVAVDGALYERVPRFTEAINNALKQIFGAGVNITMELRKDGTGLGAGLLAALVASASS